MTTIRQLGSVRRADGRVEDVTFAVEPLDDGGLTMCDFRTDDGEPLVLGAGEALELDLPIMEDDE